MVPVGRARVSVDMSEHEHEQQQQVSQGQQRDAKGRFVKGNAGGPGNPFARQVAALRQVVLECVSADDLKAIVQKLVEKAKQGDVAASKLVLQYTLGRPAVPADPDRLDGDELQAFRANAMPGDGLELLRAVPAESLLPVLRVYPAKKGKVLQQGVEQGVARWEDERAKRIQEAQQQAQKQQAQQKQQREVEETEEEEGEASVQRAGSWEELETEQEWQELVAGIRESVNKRWNRPESSVHGGQKEPVPAGVGRKRRGPG